MINMNHTDTDNTTTNNENSRDAMIVDNVNANADLLESSGNPQTASSSLTITSQEQLLERRHARFIACLERYGSEGKYPWIKIADELGDDWNVTDVQKYAYQYLMTLLNNDQDETDDSTEAENESSSSPTLNDEIDVLQPTTKNQGKNSHNDNNHIEDDEEWTLEETILFDTLLARYYNNGTQPSSSPIYSHSNICWVDQVAAFIPQKTSYQVKQRYEQLYGDEASLGHTPKT